MANALIDTFDLWTTAQTLKTSNRGLSASNQSLLGIKKLRELILELALQGKLTQSFRESNPELVSGPNSAKALIEKIITERLRNIKEGKIKKQELLPEVVEDEKSFELPETWEWVRLQQIIQISSGDGLIASQMESNGTIPVFGGNGINGYHNKGNITKPTIVIGRVGFYCGSIHITPQLAWVTDNAFITTFSEENIYINFLYWLLKGTNLKEDESATAQPVISGRKVYPLVVGLPPLAEQHCIVAKVDELIALCDQLEQQQTSSNEAHQTLVDTLLGILINAKNPEDFEEAWQRIANHLDTLLTTEYSIDQLKQTILQLAVMGKLVPRNPDDEPASELLKRIEKEKDQLGKQGKIKKQAPLPKIAANKKPFDLQNNWNWASLQSLVFLLGDGLHGTPEYTPDTKYYFVNGNNLSNGRIEIKPDTKTVSKEEMLKYRKELTSNTVLVSINGTLGNVAFYNGEEIMLGKSACYFNLSENIYKCFIKIVLESPYFTEYAFQNATGTTIKNLGLKAMNEFPIPLPPYTMQHRIVAKVDELFALCDALKERLRDAQALQNQLAEAVVGQGV